MSDSTRSTSPPPPAAAFPAPRPPSPSPAPSRRSSLTSSHAVVSTATSSSRRRTVPIRIGVHESPIAAASPRPSRFDASDVAIEEAMEYVQRPHHTWDTASKELARLATQRQRLDDDARSNVSSVSAYSVKSSQSTANCASMLKRKGSLSGLPQGSGQATPTPDLLVGGSGMGGFSHFTGPKGTGTTASAHPHAAATPSPLSSSPWSTTNAADHGRRTSSVSVAGTPAGRSGIRNHGALHGGGGARYDSTARHPSSAPGSTRETSETLGVHGSSGGHRGGGSSNGGRGGGGGSSASPPPQFDFQFVPVTTGFVPKMGPKRGR